MAIFSISIDDGDVERVIGLCVKTINVQKVFQTLKIQLVLYQIRSPSVLQLIEKFLSNNVKKVEIEEAKLS